MGQVIDLTKVQDMNVKELLDIFDEIIEEAPEMGMPEMAVMAAGTKREILTVLRKHAKV